MSSSYDPRTFSEDHLIEATGLLGWLGRSRKNKILNFLSPRKLNSVLDVGCGYGEILESLETPLKVGVDINLEALKEAKKRCPSSIFILCDIERLPFRPGVFDGVVCTEVLEHVDSPKVLADEIARVTRKGGYFCLTVPNEMITTLGRFLLGKRPCKTPAHKSAFTWRSFKKLFSFPLAAWDHVPFKFLPFLCSTNLVALFQKHKQ